MPLRQIDTLSPKCQTALVTSTETSKSDGILDSSLAVFCRYGFQKTSMLDIAQAAGMSRATLYLHFKNKEDVFRSGAIRTHAKVMNIVETELSRSSAVFERVEAALVVYFSGLMEEISASPHGSELFDASAELVGDVARDTRRELIRLIAAALIAADDAGEIELSRLGVSNEQLAILIIAAVDGLKHGGATSMPVRSGVALQLQLVQVAVDKTR